MRGLGVTGLVCKFEVMVRGLGLDLTTLEISPSKQIFPSGEGLEVDA